VFGGLLANAGFRVQLVNRTASSAEAVQTNGLELELDQGLIRAHPDATTPERVGNSRVVMIFTKTNQTASAIAGVASAMSPETDWVTLQNGLGNGKAVKDAVGAARVFHGVTMLPATLVRPGQIVSHGTHQTWLGPLDAADQSRAQEICMDLAKAGFETDCSDPVLTPIWQKACFNIAMNAANALIGAGPGLIGDTPELMKQVHAIADEALAVARADGAVVDGDKVHALIEYACAKHRYHKPSMLQDVLAERSTEIDSLNGHIVRRSEALDLAAPLNRLMHALILAKQAAPAFWKEQA